MARVSPTLFATLLLATLPGCSSLSSLGSSIGSFLDGGSSAGWGSNSASSSQIATNLKVADAAARRGDMEGAALLYARVLTSEPDNLRAARGLASVLERGDRVEAAGAHRRVLALDPTDRDSLRGLGRLELVRGQPQTALDTYRKLLALDGKDIVARNGIAVAYDQLGEFDKAQAEYRAQLEAQPDNRAIRNNLGFSLLLAGNPKEAVAVLEPLADDSRATPQQRQTLALAYAIDGREADAERIGRMDLDAETVRANLQFLHGEVAALPTAATAPGTVQPASFGAAPRIVRNRPQPVRAASRAPAPTQTPPATSPATPTTTPETPPAAPPAASAPL